MFLNIVGLASATANADGPGSVVTWNARVCGLQWSRASHVLLLLSGSRVVT